MEPLRNRSLYSADVGRLEVSKALLDLSVLHSLLKFTQVLSLTSVEPLTETVLLPRDFSSNFISRSVVQQSANGDENFYSVHSASVPFGCWCRPMSTKGRSMRSRVERRMNKESGKTMREIRRAKKLRKKLMTDEERLIYNLKRAKKKVALLLQKLKKYELPELPPPLHDPELLTPEQLQAYKKIGFKNKNYVPVGVRGVFGGVVQNMHLHWKFHETVQVCCDNFPKEKIKEMATIIARLSGGIVINIHNIKTIIMFRGRNYRQPKNLIPINTLTKRKALFKARFEQALESQKLNIKKIEQQLRRMGVNPEDPIAMASIQRVASTFFNAIDKKEGSPYVFQGEKQPVDEIYPSEPPDESDQEELDRFISEIEDAADREWAEEEAAEKEEAAKIRYWNKEDFCERFKRLGDHGGYDSDDGDRRSQTGWMQTKRGKGATESSDGEQEDEWGSDGPDNLQDYADGSDEEFDSSRGTNKHNRAPQRRNAKSSLRKGGVVRGYESEEMISDLDDAMWESDDEEGLDPRGPNTKETLNYRSSSDEEECYHPTMQSMKNMRDSDFSSEGTDSDSSQNNI
ncbi:hypothetical protein SAY87_008630 [Trapa incisa]|uniref:CRM domain-containing protein n=1 Tax=Trapa incisa TaxID=236973 RepID=A0AAN7JUP8_9MYRT|nr:hypothetical protein SAY87_008630 [Trapa incisa]